VPGSLDSQSYGRPLLPLGEVDFFSVRVAARGLAGLLADRALLDSDEQRRADRFLFARDRDTFIAAHALVRRALSRYVDLPPQLWQFQLGPYGRPEIADALPSGLPRLRFNLSHTHGFAVCAVTRELDLGVDVETLDRRAPLEIVDHFFAPAEVAALRGLPLAMQGDRFFVYWTLKEAYIKARGMGLALPLHQFAFVLVPKQPIAITFGPELTDDPASWNFASFAIGDCYRVALAVRSHGRPLRLRKLLEYDEQVGGVDAVAWLDE
jgi:4'-phosphopantetheinyl transferase